MTDNDKTLSNAPGGGLLVAIDGPSGTGKSTTSRALAERLGAKYLDTGAMYRVATLFTLRSAIDPQDADAVVAATRDLPVEVSDDPASHDVLLAGENVADEIRGPEVTANVSAVAAIPEVRDNLVALQRELAHNTGRIVVEGRDIGTVVLPDAPAKVFLTASAQVRAKRRFDQDTRAGRDVAYEDVLADVKRRDRADSTRESSPLRAANDATVVDTSHLSPAEVLDRLVGIVADSATPATRDGREAPRD